MAKHADGLPSTTAKANAVAVVERRSRVSCRAAARHTTARAASCRQAAGASVERLDERALDVTRFRDREDLRVVEWLAEDVAQRESTTGVCGGALQHLEKERLRHV